MSYWAQPDVKPMICKTHLQIRCRLPFGHDALEVAAREAVGRKLKRGNLQLSLNVSRVTEAPALRVNHELLNQILTLVDGIGASHQNIAPARWDGILSIKGVLEPVEAEQEDAEAVRAARETAMKVTLEQASKGVAGSVQNPQSWWAFPANSPTHRIPGFADRAYEEGARTFFIRGQMGDPTPEAAEMLRYCGPAADVSKVTAPVHIYQGGADPLVKIDQAEYWRGHFPNVASFRVFPGEGHDVQYRHWDQVLIELAGFTDQTVLCDAGKTRAVPTKETDGLVAKGATLGICAWTKR